MSRKPTSRSFQLNRQYFISNLVAIHSVNRSSSTLGILVAHKAYRYKSDKEMHHCTLSLNLATRILTIAFAFFSLTISPDFYADDIAKWLEECVKCLFVEIFRKVEDEQVGVWWAEGLSLTRC